MVVKVESETTEVAPCQFPHLVSQHCIAYTYGIRWGRTYTTLNKKSNVPQVESESWDDSMESKCSSDGVENESKNENQSNKGETTVMRWWWWDILALALGFLRCFTSQWAQGLGWPSKAFPTTNYCIEAAGKSINQPTNQGSCVVSILF